MSDRRERGVVGIAVMVLPPLVPLVVVLAAAEAIVRVGWVPAYLLPPPSKVFGSLGKDWPELSTGVLNTAVGSIAGFLLSAVAGIAIAVALSSRRWIQRAFYPYAVFFQTVPIIAIAPLLVIWIGYGWRTAVASAFIASVFPVIASALAGLRSTDPALIDLFRLYGATPGDMLFKLRLPSALPNILTGLRIAGGLAVIGSIVGEFIGGPGSLGDVITSAITAQHNEKVFAAVFLASMLGLALFGAISLLSWVLLRKWHASEKR